MSVIGKAFLTDVGMSRVVKVADTQPAIHAPAIRFGLGHAHNSQQAGESLRIVPQFCRHRQRGKLRYGVNTQWQVGLPTAEVAALVVNFLPLRRVVAD
jgi:hypothetical protein